MFSRVSDVIFLVTSQALRAAHRWNHFHFLVVPFAEGEFVVIQWDHKWTRACIQKVDSTGERHIVRLLDHGGYWTVSSRQMRVLLPQFMLLPFQAIEIFLANIQSKNGNCFNAFSFLWTLCMKSFFFYYYYIHVYYLYILGIWLQSAYNLVSSISKFGIGQAQVEGYIENNVYTNIYFSFSNFGVSRQWLFARIFKLNVLMND